MKYSIRSLLLAILTCALLYGGVLVLDYFDHRPVIWLEQPNLTRV